MIEKSAVYIPSPNGRLWQGEILSDLVEPRVLPSAVELIEKGRSIQVSPKKHPLAVVLMQDCDLKNDYDLRKSDPNDPKLLPSILLCEAHYLEDMKSQGPQGELGGEIWKRLIANRDERYQALQNVTPDEDREKEGLPALGVDFKLLLTLPSDFLYAQLERGTRRRCRLESPYLEHFVSRFFRFHCRIAIPAPHQTKPT